MKALANPPPSHDRGPAAPSAKASDLPTADPSRRPKWQPDGSPRAVAQQKQWRAAFGSGVVQGYFKFSEETGDDKGKPEVRSLKNMPDVDDWRGYHYADIINILRGWATDSEPHPYKDWPAAIEDAFAEAGRRGIQQKQAPIAVPLQGVVLALMHALDANDASLLHEPIAAELRAKEPSKKGLTDFAKQVLKFAKDEILAGMHKWTWSDVDEDGNFRYGTSLTHVVGNSKSNTYSSVNGADEVMRVAFLRGIWAKYGGYFEEEAFNPQDKEWSLDTRAKSVVVGGFVTHLTGRAEGDEALVVDALSHVVKLMGSIDPEAFAKYILKTKLEVMGEALHRKDVATGNPENVELNQAIAVNASKMTTEKEAIPYAIGVVNRWKAASNQTIHLVFDRARLKDVYGQSKYNKEATPANLMKDGTEGLTEKQRVTINLDATGSPKEISVVALHEIAHSIGFNPSDCDATGHFKASGKYEELEATFGPKLLFDAYFFETLMERLL